MNICYSVFLVLIVLMNAIKCLQNVYKNSKNGIRIDFLNSQSYGSEKLVVFRIKSLIQNIWKIYAFFVRNRHFFYRRQNVYNYRIHNKKCLTIKMEQDHVNTIPPEHQELISKKMQKFEQKYTTKNIFLQHLNAFTQRFYLFYRMSQIFDVLQ